ncbi:cytochrome P450 [Daldinia eschscholtzii]|nr:cytochrome P450 [Daldinia eschscholtzii]
MISEEISNRLPLLVPVFLVGCLIYWILESSQLPDLPIVGVKPGEWFPLTRARWRNFKDIKAALELAYSNYRHQTCILPLAAAHDYVLLPLEEFGWLVNQPESDFSYEIEDELQLKPNMFLDRPSLHTVLRNRAIPTTLTKETYNLSRVLQEEIQNAVDGLLGADTNGFREICVYNVVKNISGKVMSSLFVGQFLCHHTDFCNAAIAFGSSVQQIAVLLHFIWTPFRPLAGLVLTFPARVQAWKMHKIIGREVRRQLNAPKARGLEPKPQTAGKDFLQSTIDIIRTSSDPHRFKLDMLFGSIRIFVITSMTTVTGAMTHAILSLAYSKQEYLEELRVEITSVTARHGKGPDKQVLASMVKLDSSMRESQRVNTLVIFSVPRRVVKKGGIKTPSGIHVPRGAVIVVPAYSIMHDAAIYPDPYTFKPFRFAGDVAMPDQGTSKSLAEELVMPTSPSPRRKRQGWTQATPEYTSFGYGPHACPGRSIAAVVVKLMMAYIIAHYDFEVQGKRPENVILGASLMTPQKATIRVRRRKEEDIGFAW